MKGFLSLLSRFNKRVRECFLLLFPTFASLVSAATYEQYVDGLYYIFDSSTGKAAVTYTTNFDKIYYDDYNNIDHNKINYDDSYIEIPETVFAYNYETGSFMDFEVTAIGDSAFARSYNLEEIYLPSSIKTIGKSAFEGCVNLPRIELPEDVTLIDEAAFRYCKNLTDIDLPASLDSLGNYAFEFSGLKSIVIPECVKYLDRQISDCPNLEYVSIPKSVIYVWVWAFQRDAKLKRIDVSYYNTNYQSIGGILYDKSGTELVAYPADLEQHVNVPSFVKKIKTFAFEENKKMLSVVIPESVEIIEFRAFMQCGNLEKVTFSDGLKEIGGEAFAECFSLKEMTLPNSVERIAVGAFGACAISEVVLPNNLTEISSRFTEKESSWGAGRHPGSFSGCSELKNVVLPESLSNIGLGAFYMCKNLETINIPASVTSIDKNALKGCNNAVVTLCSDKFSATDEVFKDVKEVVLCDELKENPVDKELNQNDLTPDFVIEGWFNVDEKTSRLVPLDACGAVYHVYINPQGDNAMFAIKYSNAKGGIKEVNSSIDQKLLKVENNHDGEGLCQFTLPGSSTLRDFYMDISKDPVAVSETVPENYEMIMISTDSKLKSVNIGSKIKFTTNLCISDANADPTYSWQISKDGETWIEPSSNTGKDFEYTALSDIKYIKCEGLYVDASDETHTVKSNVITLSLNDPTFNVEIVGNGVRNVNTTEKEVPALSNVIIKMVDLPSSNVSNPKISYKPLGGTSSYKTLDDAVLNEDDLSWSVYADKSGRMKIEVDVEVPTFYDTPKTVTLKKEFIFRLVYSPDKEDAVLELFFDDFGYFKGNEYHYVKYEDGTVIDSNAVETVDASLPSSVKWMDDQNGFIKEHKFALTDSKNDFSSILEDGKVNIDKCWTMGENVRPYRCWCENGYRVEDGYYAFVPNPAMADGGPKSDGSSNDYWNGSDHTGSADGSSLGAMLMVNCADVNDKVIYERDFEINGDHSDVKVFFSAFVSNAQALSDAGAPVNIRMDIYEKGGTEVITSIESGDVISRNYGANSWSNLTASFPLSKGKFTLKISNSAASGSGNDILLDDISLKISSPVQTQPGIVPAITTAKLCEANVTSLLVTGADALSTANVGREKDYVYKVNGSDVTLQVSGVFGPAVDVVWEKCETKPNDLASFVWTPVATQKSNIPLVVSVTSDVIYRATFNKGMPGHSGKQDQRALFVTSGLISDISKACPNEAVQLDVIGGKFSSRTEWLLGYGSDAVKRVKEYTDGTMTFTLNASDSPLKGYVVVKYDEFNCTKSATSPRFNTDNITVGVETDCKKECQSTSTGEYYVGTGFDPQNGDCNPGGKIPNDVYHFFDDYQIIFEEDSYQFSQKTGNWDQKEGNKYWLGCNAEDFFGQKPDMDVKAGVVGMNNYMFAQGNIDANLFKLKFQVWDDKPNKGWEGVRGKTYQYKMRAYIQLDKDCSGEKEKLANAKFLARTSHGNETWDITEVSAYDNSTSRLLGTKTIYGPNDAVRLRDVIGQDYLDKMTGWDLVRFEVVFYGSFPMTPHKIDYFTFTPRFEEFGCAKVAFDYISAEVENVCLSPNVVCMGESTIANAAGFPKDSHYQWYREDEPGVWVLFEEGDDEKANIDVKVTKLGKQKHKLVVTGKVYGENGTPTDYYREMEFTVGGKNCAVPTPTAIEGSGVFCLPNQYGYKPDVQSEEATYTWELIGPDQEILYRSEDKNPHFLPTETGDSITISLDETAKEGEYKLILHTFGGGEMNVTVGEQGNPVYLPLSVYRTPQISWKLVSDIYTGVENEENKALCASDVRREIVGVATNGFESPAVSRYTYTWGSRSWKKNSLGEYEWVTNTESDILVPRTHRDSADVHIEKIGDMCKGLIDSVEIFVTADMLGCASSDSNRYAIDKDTTITIDCATLQSELTTNPIVVPAGKDEVSFRLPIPNIYSNCDSDPHIDIEISPTSRPEILAQMGVLNIDIYKSEEKTSKKLNVTLEWGVYDFKYTVTDGCGRHESCTVSVDIRKEDGPVIPCDSINDIKVNFSDFNTGSKCNATLDSTFISDLKRPHFVDQNDEKKTVLYGVYAGRRHFDTQVDLLDRETWKNTPSELAKFDITIGLLDEYEIDFTYILWKFTNDAGNSSYCVQEVWVEDKEAPYFDCNQIDPFVFRPVTKKGECEIKFEDFWPELKAKNYVAYDSCPEPVTPIYGELHTDSVLSTKVNDTYLFKVGIADTIYWQFRDRHDNVKYCPQVINAFSGDSVIFDCDDIADVVGLANPGTCEVEAAKLNIPSPVATEPCPDENGNKVLVPGIGTRSDGKALTDPYPTGDTYITWLFDAKNSYSKTCVTHVFVKGNKHFNLDCSVLFPDRVIEIPECDSTKVKLEPQTVPDPCVPGYMAESVPYFTEYVKDANDAIVDTVYTLIDLKTENPYKFPKVGEWFVSWVFWDYTHNISDTCVQSIHLRDNKPPIFDCNTIGRNDSMFVTLQGKCSIPFKDLRDSLGYYDVTEACTGDKIHGVPYLYDPVSKVRTEFPNEVSVGIYTVIWVFANDSLTTEETTCIKTLLLQHDMEPKFDCNTLESPLVLIDDKGLCVINLDQDLLPIPEAYDACKPDYIVYGRGYVQLYEDPSNDFIEFCYYDENTHQPVYNNAKFPNGGLPLGGHLIKWVFKSPFSTVEKICYQKVKANSDAIDKINCDDFVSRVKVNFLGSGSGASYKEVLATAGGRLIPDWEKYDVCRKIDTLFTRDDNKDIYRDVYPFGSTTIFWLFKDTTRNAEKTKLCETVVVVENGKFDILDKTIVLPEGKCEIPVKDVKDSLDYPVAIEFCTREEIVGEPQLMTINGKDTTYSALPAKFEVRAEPYKISWLFANDSLTVFPKRCDFDLTIKSSTKPVFDCSIYDDTVKKYATGSCDVVLDETILPIPEGHDFCLPDSVVYGKGYLIDKNDGSYSLLAEMKSKTPSYKVDKLEVGVYKIAWVFASKYSTALDTCVETLNILTDRKMDIACVDLPTFEPKRDDSCSMAITLDAPVAKNPCTNEVILPDTVIRSDGVKFTGVDDVFRVGQTTVTWIFVDHSKTLKDSIDTCVQIVQVGDVKTPVIQCPNDIFVILPIGESQLSPDSVHLNATEPTFIDFCADTIVPLLNVWRTSGKTIADPFELGVDTVVREYLYHGKVYTCEQIINVSSAEGMTMIDVPVVEIPDFIYNGEIQTIDIPESPYYTVSGDTLPSAGTHTVIISLVDKENTAWKDGTVEDINISFTIAKATVEAPVVDSTAFVYNGDSVICSIKENDYYIVNSSVQAIVGKHTVVISLKDSVNYSWSDGSSDDLLYTFDIPKTEESEPDTLPGDIHDTIPGDIHDTIPEVIPDSVPEEIRLPESIVVSGDTISINRPGDYLYDLEFDSLAHEQGFVDVEGESGKDGIKVPIPEDVKPGVYDVTVIVTNPDSTVVEKEVKLTVPYPNSLIVRLLYDVLAVDNTSKEFVSYQWYKNGKKIDGATQQFYCDLDGIRGVYKVEVVNIAGDTLFITERKFDYIAPMFNITISKNPVNTFEAFDVIIEGISDPENLRHSSLVVYDMKGVAVINKAGIKVSNTISIGNVGEYIVVVRNADGKSISKHLLVK